MSCLLVLCLGLHNARLDPVNFYVLENKKLKLVKQSKEGFQGRCELGQE